MVYGKIINTKDEIEEADEVFIYMARNDSGAYTTRAVPTQDVMVDLGLPSGNLWSPYNVGAKVETDFGYYFQWGEIVGHDLNYSGGTTGNPEFDYTIATVHTNGGYSYWNEDYFKSISGLCVNENGELLPHYDAATYYYGAAFCTPTSGDVKELIDNTTTAETTINGVIGIQCTSKINGKKIFSPSGGVFSNKKYNPTQVNKVWQWSSTLDLRRTPIGSHPFVFGNESGRFIISNDWGLGGCNIRAIKKVNRQ